MERVPLPVQRGDKQLVLTKLPLDPEPQYILWFYHHMRRLGHRSYPTLEEAYHMGQYWLRKGRRQYPGRRYRFALGEPLYVALQLRQHRGKTVISEKASFLDLEDAQQRVYDWEQRARKTAWGGNSVKVFHTQIVVGYEWAWHQLKSSS